MTELLDRAMRAMQAATALPPAEQDDIARLVLFATGADESVYRLTDEDIEAIALSRAQAARGEFASEELINAIWAKAGL